MILRGIAYSAIILVGLSTPSIVTGGPLPWRSPGFSEVFAISALVAFSLSTLSEMTRLLGREATIALIFGRYVRPRLETRVVLIADLVGSTALAERIGELRFHDCLRDVMLDLSVAIDATRGDVHRYVGDAVIVTWPLATGVAQSACLVCAERMHAELHRRRDAYLATYGMEPRLRIALHCGQLAAGEIGDWKKEIALLGDTMNTTARLEVAAKENAVGTVVSDDLYRRLPPDRSAPLVRLPDFTAKGKESAVMLWTTDQVA
jgi:adenylate cyclase